MRTDGLDLASEAGAKELEKRIDDAALTACKEIGRLYPESTPSGEACARKAAKTPMFKANKLISAARKAPAK